MQSQSKATEVASKLIGSIGVDESYTECLLSRCCWLARLTRLCSIGRLGRCPRDVPPARRTRTHQRDCGNFQSPAEELEDMSELRKVSACTETQLSGDLNSMNYFH